MLIHFPVRHKDNRIGTQKNVRRQPVDLYNVDFPLKCLTKKNLDRN